MPGVLTILVFIDPMLPEFTIIGWIGRTSTQEGRGEEQQEDSQQDSHHWIPLHWDAGLKGSGEVTSSTPALGAAIWRVRGAIRFDVGQVHPEIA